MRSAVLAFTGLIPSAGLRFVLPEPGYAREVAVAATAAGATVVHVAWRDDGERVVRHDLVAETWSPPEEVTPARRAIRRPSVVASGAIAWAEHRGRAMEVVAGERRFGARSSAPALAVDDGGAAIVAFERRGRIEVRDVATGRLVAKTPASLRATDPVLAPDAAGFALAFEADGAVWLARGRGRAERISPPPAVAAAPAIARLADGRLAVAWHESSVVAGRPDLPRWVAIRIVDADGARVVSGEMRGRDLDRRGEDQGLEFPVLVPSPDGTLVVLARGSHCFYRQDVGAGGFGDLVRLSEVQWGCRGRRAAACRLADGRLLSVRREKEGLVAEVLEPSRARGRIPTSPLPPPARVRGAKPRHRPRFRAHGLSAFFGDLHQHSAHSDGTGTAAERWRACRDRYRDDFAALSDHESFLGKRTGPGEWGLLQEVAESFHAPGRFVTLFAYEWTAKMHPGPGHKVVYFPAPGRPLLSRDDPKTAEGPGLLARVRKAGGLAFPHHVGWTGADVSSHDPRVQTCWEIVSCHGCYEHVGNPIGHRGDLAGQFVRENLDAGLRFGFVGASDGHGLLWHHGISRKRDPFRTGLAGILAPRLTRAAIWDALRRRRCYATSGAKIGVSVSVEGAPMGSEIRARRPLVMEVRFRGTARVDRVDVVTNGGKSLDFEPKRERGAVRLQVAIEPGAPGAYFYARIVQEDGEMAWTSPVWLDRP